ncbi:hypothetical protein TMRO357_02728 [Alteriqipengyuania sp. 357]
MQVELYDAMRLADELEELLEDYGISVGAHRSTGADMLSLWRVLERMRLGLPVTPNADRNEYAAGVAVHDLAAKVMAVRDNPAFRQLVPHLAMLAKGAVHLTQQPPADADVYNKLIEIYWACLLMADHVDVSLDHPINSSGDNPDVIANDSGKPARAYAFKTIRSQHTQNILDHLVKGVEQIERSAAEEGMVCFHLTPRILDAGLWPQDSYYLDWRVPVAQATELLSKWISQVVIDNGQSVVDNIFQGRKAVGTVLCIALFPTVARNPKSGNPVVMPIKVAILVEVSPTHPISNALHREVEAANVRMQTVLNLTAG